METLSAEAIVRSCFRRVYHFCRSMLRNPADADDACQEVFLTVTRRRGELADVRSPVPWVMKIALLTCLYARRKRGKALPLESDVEAPARAPIPAREDLSRVRAAIDRLPDRYRAVLTLHFQQAMPHEEMAEVLGVSRGTLRVLLHRAIARLREECS